MRCPACGFENASGIKFCGECGAPLKLKCSSCGFENAPGIKFCGECGKPLGEAAKPGPPPDPRSYTPKHLADKILQSRSALEGERKQVTVLFADVKGSMELAEQLDPEEWHKILDRFFQILTDGVHRFEGTVNQYTGDGIMALFGAPIAHEDHAQRACYAALHLRDASRAYADELQRDAGVGFSTRMGLNSGEVVVGRIGDDLRMDYTAQGHTVGLAQRMEQLAAPDTGYVTAHTAALVDGYFELEDLGEFASRACASRCGVYASRAPGARAPASTSRVRAVSRASSVAPPTCARWRPRSSAARGNGQVVGVVAEAGTGKSRLCFEFLERCRARGFTYYRRARRARPKHPVPADARGLPRLLRHHEQGRRPRAREKIAGRMLLLDEGLRDTLPILFDFLGVPDPRPAAARIDPEALPAPAPMPPSAPSCAPTASARSRLSLLFEDLHWLDAASDAYLAQIIEAIATTRGLNLVNFRPEYRAEWMQTPSYQQLPLVPLAAEAVRELLGKLCSAPRKALVSSG